MICLSNIERLLLHDSAGVPYGRESSGLLAQRHSMKLYSKLHHLASVTFMSVQADLCSVYCIHQGSKSCMLLSLLSNCSVVSVSAAAPCLSVGLGSARGHSCAWYACDVLVTFLY